MRDSEIKTLSNMKGAYHSFRRVIFYRFCGGSLNLIAILVAVWYTNNSKRWKVKDMGLLPMDLDILPPSDDRV